MDARKLRRALFFCGALIAGIASAASTAITSVLWIIPGKDDPIPAVPRPEGIPPPFLTATDMQAGMSPGPRGRWNLGENPLLMGCFTVAAGRSSHDPDGVRNS